MPPALRARQSRRCVVIWFVAGVMVGANVGLLISAWLRYIAHQDNDATAYRALRAVHQENGALTQQTRSIVMDALLQHDTTRRPR